MVFLKKYIEPTVEVLIFEMEDVVMQSGTGDSLELRGTNIGRLKWPELSNEITVEY